jgi:nitric oxide reductase subunit B
MYASGYLVQMGRFEEANGEMAQARMQLYHSVNEGYFYARSLEFLNNRMNILITWLRFPGDVLFIVGGILPVLYLAWLGIRHSAPQVTLEEPTETLFTEVVEVGTRES